MLDLLGEKRAGETLTRRDLARLGVELVMVAFYGGLSGWAILYLFPDVKNELLGILSAVLGSGGPKVTKKFLSGMLERSLGVKVDEVLPTPPADAERDGALAKSGRGEKCLRF